MPCNSKLPRGIREIRDGKHDAKPFQVEHRGKRSYFATAEEAITEKKRLKGLEVKHGTESIQYSRHAHAEYETSMNLLRAAGIVATLPDVTQFYIQHHQTADGAPKTVIEAARLFLERKENLNRSTRHVKDLKSRLNQFSAQFGNRQLSSLTRSEIEEWLLGLNLSPRTIRNYFITLSNFFNSLTRWRWTRENPISDIAEDDLPTVPNVMKRALTLDEAKGYMAHIEAHEPRYVLWSVVQLFLGIRNAEAERFKVDWIDYEQRRVIIPGWALVGDKVQQGSKTQDDWVIYDVEPVFWEWANAYPEYAFARNKATNRIRHALADKGIINKWPSNALRRTYTTNHISLYRDAPRTALVLRHQNPRRLLKNYLARMVPKDQAVAFFNNIKPTKP
ncbi:tyrosine-type recombinase/integrase [Cerasicoccus frondis]|uniref:tyrosine-type recombinase/integrase n=1 Tax=Cerasicoccus frondis TaxID=490090 RepID=UPI002852A8CF|nr:hypothetical protein [Cerasicoccus frondis]